MSHDQETTIADVLRGRMATYQFLSRLFRVEVDQELYDALVSMRFPTNTGNVLVDEGYRMICGYLSQADGTVLTELAVDYVRAFIGSGNDGFSAAYPYESVYTSEGGLMMQEAYAEVLHVYRNAGFAKNPGFKEPEDHLAVELAFMALLCGRAVEALRAGDEAGAERQLRAQREFLSDHLLNWIDRFTSDVRKAAEDGFYFDLATFTEDFLTADAAELAEVLG